MATFTAPVTFAQTQAVLGFSYVFAANAMAMALSEDLDPAALGLVTGVGDLAGSGSDTFRLTFIDGLGRAEAFTTMGSETAAITATGFDADNDTVTIARRGLAKEESFQNRLLGREDTAAVFLENLVAFVPASIRRTIMDLTATAYQSITGSVGATGTVWTFDDEMDMLAALRETDGFEGIALANRHPEQYTQLIESMRNEPAYQSAEVDQRLASLANSNGITERLWGVDNISSNRITQSGGDHIGAVYAPGAFVLAHASTAALGNIIPSDQLVAAFPDQGLVITRSVTGNTATGRWDANLWDGVAQRSPLVFPAFKLISLDT